MADPTECESMFGAGCELEADAVLELVLSQWFEYSDEIEDVA